MTTSTDTRFRVTGMDCAACAAKVEAATRRVAGVEGVSVSVTAGTMTVQHSGADLTQIARKVTDALVEAARNYRPGAYAGRVVMFRSETSDDKCVSHRFGWGEVIAPSSPIVAVDGWHEDAFTAEGLRAMAATVQDELLKHAAARS